MSTATAVEDDVVTDDVAAMPTLPTDLLKAAVETYIDYRREVIAEACDATRDLLERVHTKLHEADRKVLEAEAAAAKAGIPIGGRLALIRPIGTNIYGDLRTALRAVIYEDAA